MFSRALSLRQKGWPGLKQILVRLPDGAGYRELIENLVSPIPLHAIGSHSEALSWQRALITMRVRRMSVIEEPVFQASTGLMAVMYTRTTMTGTT